MSPPTKRQCHLTFLVSDNSQAACPVVLDLACVGNSRGLFVPHFVTAEQR